MNPLAILKTASKLINRLPQRKRQATKISLSLGVAYIFIKVSALVGVTMPQEVATSLSEWVTAGI